MFKKMVFLVPFLLVGYQEGAFAEIIRDAGRSALKQAVLSVQVSPFEYGGMSTFPVTAASDKDDKDEENKALQKELDAIIEQMKMLEKEAREKFIKEILPKLKKELERLRKRLREWHPNDDEPERRRT